MASNLKASKMKASKKMNYYYIKNLGNYLYNGTTYKTKYDIKYQ